MAVPYKLLVPYYESCDSDGRKHFQGQDHENSTAHMEHSRYFSSSPSEPLSFLDFGLIVQNKVQVGYILKVRWAVALNVISVGQPSRR
jgi:hypothetical protein